ncbi:MAG: UPF0755 protein [Candidatus Paceibacteria bacterium]|jgi:UPF0755 protein
MTDEPFQFTPECRNKNKHKKSSYVGKVLSLTAALIFVAIILLGVSYWYASVLNEPPANFPVNKSIIIEKGTDVMEITEILEQEGVVRSSVLLYYTLVLFHDSTDVKASSYVFENPLSAFAVAERLTQGDFDTDLIRFTHFEGERVTILAKRAEQALPNFDVKAFIASSTPHEGKLFPDTYFIPTEYNDAELLILLLDTFEQKIAGFDEQIQVSDLTLDEILVLASIIEREANTAESKKAISGVFKNRMNIGMALQADASIEYILDKPLSELTPDDLEIDSPYNTYLYLDLPPTPIGNPGFDAIDAVLNPTESEYYYYITDNDGVFHYSKTYSEHLRNIELYLR